MESVIEVIVRKEQNKNGESQYRNKKVLTKQEASRYEKGQSSNGINIVVNGLTVREESDINKIASQLLKKINENKIVYGGSY